MSTTTELAPLQQNYTELSKHYLTFRSVNNPEFEAKYVKTFSDMLFSQTDDMLNKLSSIREQSLMNAVFRAAEIGASFAKKQISILPFEIKEKTKVNGVEVERGTGKYDVTIVVDINYQKQLILAMPNCKKFFTAEVHEGVTVIEDLSTGNFVFEGVNHPTKNTIGYYACFLTTDGIMYDMFMPNAKIIERAAMNPHYKEKLYQNPNGNIHFEKIVVRNLMKIIPNIPGEIATILSSDDLFSDYETLSTKKLEGNKSENALEAAKREISENATVVNENDTTEVDCEKPKNEQSMPEPKEPKAKPRAI